LNVNGQIVDWDAPFQLTGDPRPWGDEIHSPPFHWNCRTSAVIYQAEFDDGVTEELRELSRNERARRADIREKIAEVQKELASYGTQPDARKRKADDKYTKALRKELKQYKKQLVSVRAKPPRTRPARPAVQTIEDYGESWRGSLSEKESAALDEYQGTTYRVDNAVLRRSVNQPEWEPTSSWYEEKSGKLGGTERIDNLTEALDKAETQEDQIAYRGFAGTKTGDAMAELQPGDTFIDWGFASTSTNQEYALKEFSGYGEISAARITVPQGSKAAYLTRAAEAETMKEWELLIQRGAKFEVEGFDTIGDKRIINLRLTETAPGKFWRSSDEWWDEIGDDLYD